MSEMVVHPDYLPDYYAWLALVVFFNAFTKNVQETTLYLGKRLFGAYSSPTGVQDAITPRWQSRNNVINIVLLIWLLGFSLYVFRWYIGAVIFLAVFFIAVPFVSRFLMFPENSIFIVRKIKGDLLKRKQSFVENDDSVRAEAIEEILNRLDEITDTN